MFSFGFVWLLWISTPVNSAVVRITYVIRPVFVNVDYVITISALVFRTYG